MNGRDVAVAFAISCPCGAWASFNLRSSGGIDEDVKSWQPCCGDRKTLMLRGVTVTERLVR